MVAVMAMVAAVHVTTAVTATVIVVAAATVAVVLAAMGAAVVAAGVVAGVDMRGMMTVVPAMVQVLIGAIGAGTEKSPTCEHVLQHSNQQRFNPRSFQFNR